MIANVILWAVVWWLAFGAVIEIALFGLVGIPFGAILAAFAWLIWKNLIAVQGP